MLLYGFLHYLVQLTLCASAGNTYHKDAVQHSLSKGVSCGMMFPLKNTSINAKNTTVPLVLLNIIAFTRIQ